jgi:two-component system cell cycle sensor histidine kinase/response regulator CckA
MESSGRPATILLVDDDEGLRRFVQRLLTEQGFLVIEAADGAEALQASSSQPEIIDLLLTDVIMPKVNGVLLAQQLRQQRPGISVLFMSGYVEKSILEAKYPEAVLLQKPFTAEALITTVRRALSSRKQI